MKVYKYKQLTKAAKQKAIEDNFYVNVDEDWWDFVYQDATEVGLKITSSDVGYRQEITGEFTQPIKNVFDDIIANHGDQCRTYKTAQDYLKKYNLLVVMARLIGTDEAEEEFDEKSQELKDEFLKDLLRDYWQNLYESYEYLTSDEAIAETLISNDYEFNRDGEPYFSRQKAA